MRSREVLEDCRQLLAQTREMDAWGRAAAILIRQALEEWIRETLVARYGAMDSPTFSAQLILVQDILADDLRREVGWTWAALSSATHAHGYATPPTIGELKRWFQSVEKLITSEGSD